MLRRNALKFAVVGGLCSACSVSRSRTPTTPIAASRPSSAAELEPPSAHKAPMEVPLSRYGRFEVTLGADSECVVAYNLEKRRPRILFSVPRCDGDMPGMNTLDATDMLEAVKFPVVGTNGDEFHLFQIQSLRGGNAFPGGNDYWVVVVRANDVWSAELPQGQLGVARLPDQGGALVLEDHATTTEEGTRCTVLFGTAKTEVLPVLPSHTVGTQTRTVDGELFGGFHATHYQPVLQAASEELIIDDPGKCSLPEVGAEGGKVRMTVSVTTWSDGRTQVRCLSVQ